MSAGASLGAGGSTHRAVVVVGGGIAGLAAAWELCSEADVGGSSGAGGGPAVTVLEASNRLGGHLRTASFAGRQVDLGPDAFLTRRPEALELCRQLGMDEAQLVAPATSAAYLFAGGRLHRLPAGLALGVPTRLIPLARSGVLSAGGVARCGLDLLTPPARRAGPVDVGDVAVGALLRRRLGREVVERLADPLIGGIHAGSVEQMSAAAVFPALIEASRRGGSLMRALRPSAPPPTPGGAGKSSVAAPVFLAPRGGMGALVGRLCEALERRGVNLRTESAVVALGKDPSADGWVLECAGGQTRRVDAVVLALPAPAAATLLHPHDAALARSLGSIDYASVALVTMRFATQRVGPLPEGSGFLVARTADGLVTACTWMSSKWPGLSRPGEVLVRASLGRHGDDRPSAMDDDALVERAVAELAPAMALSGQPEEALVTRFAGAFPQYPVGHLERIASIERAAARVGGVALAGAAFGGVGIPACIASGRRAARAVKGHLEEAAHR